MAASSSPGATKPGAHPVGIEETFGGVPWPKILLADDDPTIRNLMRELLEEDGPTVLEAENGNEAIEVFRAQRPALVIVDILMPRMGGLNVIKQIQGTHAAQPIIAISGGAQKGLNFLETARTFKGVKTLEKPFHLDDLRQRVPSSLETPTCA